MTVNLSIRPTGTNLQFAFDYIELGWRVFPAHAVHGQTCSCGKVECRSPGKHPKTHHGLKDATTNRDKILGWWTKWPDANIAILTGKESGLITLDVDAKPGGANGFESLENLQNKFSELPDTLTAVTGGKGNHFCFSHPGGQIKSRTNLMDGIDFRGDGGYIIVPPSLHISGNNYYWINPDTAPKPPPDWLTDIVNNRMTLSVIDAEDTIPQGRRNITMTSFAGKKWNEGCTRAGLRTLLLEENKLRCTPPLPTGEVLKIYSQIIKYPRGQKKFLHSWKEAFRASDLPSSSKLFLHALADHMNSEGRSCYPTQEQLAQETSLTTRTIGKCRELCEGLGWIRTYQNRFEGRKYWNYGYMANIPDAK